MKTLRGFSGQVLDRDTDDYRIAVAAYGAAAQPALIVRPVSAADVAAAVNYARSEGFVLSVRSGGHSGFGPTDGGVLIDLSAIAGIDVLDGDRVRIGSGAVWGDVATALQPHKLGITAGDTASVGVGGLTLGAGIGWMVRQYGVALDNLLEAEVVLATGEIVTASAASEPELFWAIRGGGGNFGIVTQFTFQAHPLDGIVAGTISFALDSVAETLRGWRDVMRQAPRDLNSTVMAMPQLAPEMPPSLQLLVCFGGTDGDAAARAIQPLLDLPGVVSSDISAQAYRDFLIENEGAGEEVAYVDQNTFAQDFSDDLIDALATFHAEAGASVLMIRWLTGAFNEVAPDATAFAHRNAQVFIVSAVFLPQGADDEAKQAIRDAWNPMLPLTGGLYGNFTQTTGDDILNQMYPAATLERLRAAKRRYDPANLFSQNQNIAP